MLRQSIKGAKLIRLFDYRDVLCKLQAVRALVQVQATQECLKLPEINLYL